MSSLASSSARLLRYVGTTTATVWVETDRAAVVEVLGHAGAARSTCSDTTTRSSWSRTSSPARSFPTTFGSTACRYGRRRTAGPRPRSDLREGERQARLVFGSCRVGAPQSPPYTLAPSDDPDGLGVDALWAYSRQLQEGATRVAGRAAAARRPGLRRRVAAGDDRVHQSTPRRRRSRRARRSRTSRSTHSCIASPGPTPISAGCSSTVPSAMIFDDHEVSDDWNISQAWVDEMRAQPWWDERITSAFMAYWLYQHLGNLSPPELAEEAMFAQVQGDEDAGPRLRTFARMCDRESAASRWAYYRDFGRSRLLVIDSRAARVLADGRRDMVDAEEWEWIVEHARGSFDHLIVATTLPAFAPPGIHHLEAWSEAICRRALGLSRRAARRTATTRCRPRALGCLPALVRAARRPAARGQRRAGRRGARDDHDPERRRPHDVRRRGRPRTGRGPEPGLPGRLLALPESSATVQRRVVKATGSRRARSRLLAPRARAAAWRGRRRRGGISPARTFDNSIGELVLDEEAATVTHLPGEAGEGDRAVARTPLYSAPAVRQIQRRAAREAERRERDPDDRDDDDPEERRVRERRRR